jgi:hypothetical protein
VSEDLDKLHRDDLDARARAAGVQDPEALPNKAAVIEALESRTNPALVPAVEAAAPKTYVVVGPRRVHDTDPGKTFTALLTPGQESALIEGGHIEITKENPHG